MDADGVTLACATTSEERAGRRAGRRTALVGPNASRGLPAGSLISFGLAGALSDDLACGEVLDVIRVVDPAGKTLWEGEALGLGRPATILAAEGIIDDPGERRRLREATGADAADLESGPLAAAGRLVGGVRVVGDTPSRPLGPLCRGLRPDGSVDFKAVLAAFVHEPRVSMRAARDAIHALKELERTAEALS